MLHTLKQLIAHQFDAALCTLSRCIDRCPDDLWNARVGNLAFCQVAFHALFFADCYLGPDEEAVRQQPFHRENPEFFRDYEELEDRAQVLMYDKPSVQKYVQHVRAKAAQAIAWESAATLSARCGFPGRTFSRAELYVYNLRHLQHHAAQLSLRLRLDAKLETPWIGSGWRET